MNSPGVASIDHAPDDGAPRYRLPDGVRMRFAVLTAGTFVLAAGIVLAVSELLPVLAGWVLPALLSALTVLFLTAGRVAARRGSTSGARAWAGWAGATVTFAVFGLVNLAGFGGALVGVLLLVIAANAVLALWFRSPVHWTVVQVLGLGWGAVAHVFGVLPWAVLVLGLAGLWWLARVGAARSVVVSTTVTIPVAVMLLVHPLTHQGGALDGADVAVLTGGVAVALTSMAVVGRSRSVSTIWSAARSTALVVLVVQVALGAVPGVEAFLTPATPWPSELAAVAAVLVCATVVVLRPTRTGIHGVLVLCAVQLGEIAAVLVVGPAAASTVGAAGLLGLAVAALLRHTTSAGVRSFLWLAVLALPALWAAIVALPTLVVSAVLVVTGGTVALLLTVGARR